MFLSKTKKVYYKTMFIYYCDVFFSFLRIAFNHIIRSLSITIISIWLCCGGRRGVAGVAAVPSNIQMALVLTDASAHSCTRIATAALLTNNFVAGYLRFFLSFNIHHVMKEIKLNLLIPHIDVIKDTLCKVKIYKCVLTLILTVKKLNSRLHLLFTVCCILF